VQFGQIEAYGKKPSLLGVIKRPQDVVDGLFLIQTQPT
jgi:hypothetical protein